MEKCKLHSRTFNFSVTFTLLGIARTFPDLVMFYNEWRKHFKNLEEIKAISCL